MATHQILKKAQLEHFTGTSFDEQVTLWLSNLDDYYDLLETEDHERLSATPLLLRGTAKIWWQGIRGDFHTNNGTWTDFKQAMISRFEDPNRVLNARDELARLRQTTSVIRYIEEFNVLRVKAGDVSEPEAIQRFRDGLKPALQQHFRGNPDHNHSLAQVQRIAGSLDNAWHVHRVATRPAGRGYTDGSFPQPMELDAAYVQQPQRGAYSSGARLPDADKIKQEDYRLGNCYYCHKRGHKAISCPRKNSGNARS